MNNNKKNSNRNLKLLVSFLFLIILIIATISLIFTKVDFNSVIAQIQKADIRFILAAIAMTFIYLTFESIATKSILNNLEVKSSFLKNFKYSAMDYYFCAITPSATGGQPMVAYYMKKDGIEYNKSTIVLLFNTVVFKVVLLFLGIISLILYYDYIFFIDKWIAILFFIGFAINIIVIVMLLMAIFMPKILYFMAVKGLELLHKMRIVKNVQKHEQNIKNKIEKYKENGRYIKTHPWLSFRVFIYNLIQRIAFFSVAYFVYLSLGNTHVSFMGLIVVQVIIAIAVDSLPFPGGVGISEKMMLMLFEMVYLKELIVPAMLITRGLSFYFCLIFTMIIVIVNHFYVVLKTKKGVSEDVRIL